MYKPDNWVVFKTERDGDVIYKVLAGWSGGYLDSDSWRINSGIEKVTEDDHYIYFHGSSGSVYQCNKNSYGLRMNNAHIWNQIQEMFGDRVTLLDDGTTNWLEILTEP